MLTFLQHRYIINRNYLQNENKLTTFECFQYSIDQKSRPQDVLVKQIKFSIFLAIAPPMKTNKLMNFRLYSSLYHINVTWDFLILSVSVGVIVPLENFSLIWRRGRLVCTSSKMYLLHSFFWTVLIFDPPSQQLKSQETLYNSAYHCSICNFKKITTFTVG